MAAPVLLAVAARDARDLYADSLTFRGLRVEAMSAASEVVERVERVSPSVVLLSLSAIEDSLSAARQIRHAADGGRCRVVILGDSVTSDQIARADEAGALAVIETPIEAHVVVDVIEALTRL